MSATNINTTTIYTGTWVNWSHGRVLGSTITLSARNGAILTSFLATFVAVAGAQLWKILCFILHQGRTTREPKDGLYHQHQNVLRNSNTPGAAAWSFVKQSCHWWGRAPRSLLRCFPWALFSIFYVVVLAILSIFGSSQVVKAAGQDRLIRGSECGYWAVRSGESGQAPFEAKFLKDSQSAAAYARSCYGESVDALKCILYAKPNIKWDGKKAECPFKDGICYRNNTYQMDTGLIDSHHDLGINTPQEERLKYRKVTTCSVLDDKDYIKSSNDTELVTWNFGPDESEDYTFVYDKRAVNANTGYTVFPASSTIGFDSGWKPAAPLNRTDADVDLVFIAQNSMAYSTTNDDPIFSAHLISNFSLTDSEGRDVIYYEGDWYASFIACAEQYQVCHRDTCTKLASHNETFSSSRGLSMVQRGIFQRISFANIFTGVAAAINGRSGSSLRASETAIATIQASLPSNQWEIEVSSWFSTGLAMLQNVLREYASPTHIVPGTYIQQPESAIERGMCYNQKTKETSGTTSFSVLGLAIILVVGTLLILINLVLETVTGWIGIKSYSSWVLDDKLHLQRMAFEARGVRWTNIEGIVPVTEAGERFPALAASAESQALMADQDDKAVGVNVREVV